MPWREHAPDHHLCFQLTGGFAVGGAEVGRFDLFPPSDLHTLSIARCLQYLARWDCHGSGVERTAFQLTDRGSHGAGDTDGLTGGVIHCDHRSVRLGRHIAGSLTHDAVLHAEAGVTDGGDSGSHNGRVGILQLPAMVASDAGDDRAQALGREFRKQAEARRYSTRPVSHERR